MESVEFISKEEALKHQREKQPARLRAVARLEPAARHLPRHAEDPDKVGVIVDRLRAADADGRVCRRSPASTRCATARRRPNKILSATGLVKVLAAGLAILLMLASIALIANTIRLSIFARRREVEVMKLVGATNWFIRWPFVIEGVIVGFMGGGWSSCCSRSPRSTVLDPLSDRFALLAAPDTIDFPLLIAILLLGLRRGLGGG